MAGSKGCNDDFASAIIFLLNSILMILTLLGLVGVIYVWITQENLVEGQQALSVVIPEFMLITVIFVCVVVLTIALLGIIATALQMKENKDASDKAAGIKTDVAQIVDDKDDQNAKLAKKKHPCCHSWGLGIYVFLCILAFFFLLAVAIVAGMYSDKMTNFNSLDKVRDKGDEWIDTFETKLSKQVLKLADDYPEAWNNTQAAIGCCGWHFANEDGSEEAAAEPIKKRRLNPTTKATASTASAKSTTASTTTTKATTTTTTTTTAKAKADNTTTTEASTKVGVLKGNTNSKCCHNSNVITSVSIIGKINLDVGGCRKDSLNQVYTCEGVVATHIQGNLVKTSICSAVLSIVQLALAICGCVVRYPKLFAYCNCKKKNGEKVEPETTVTQVQRLNKEPMSGNI